MDINKKLEEVLEAIFKLLEIKLIKELKIEIPPNLYDKFDSDYKTVKSSHIEHLSTHFIKINALSSNSSKEIRIWFGPKMKLKSDNELIIEFQYASEIIFYLLSIINPFKVQIETSNDLCEKETIFSQPYSTFDEYRKN